MVERERGEDMQQRTTGRNRTRVAAIRTEPLWYALYPVNHQGAPYFHPSLIEFLFSLAFS